MSKRLLTLVSFSLLLLAGCKPMIGSNEVMMNQKDDTTMQKEVDENAVMMVDGSMMVRKDGAVMTMDKDMMMQNGTKVMMDGTVMMKDGTTMMMKEGMSVMMDGEIVGPDGKEMMQKKKESESMMKQENPAMDNDEDNEGGAMMQKGQYLPFAGSVLTDGHSKVLFFKASWCPICTKADAMLQDWYAAGSVPVTTYTVDYDKATDLKTKYGVTYQHTFVKLDGQGNKIGLLMSPTEDALRAFLK